jgi:hypothetical protein
VTVRGPNLDRDEVFLIRPDRPFPLVMRPGPAASHPPPSSAEFKGRVEITSTPTWVLGLYRDPFTFTSRIIINVHLPPPTDWMILPFFKNIISRYIPWVIPLLSTAQSSQPVLLCITLPTILSKSPVSWVLRDSSDLFAAQTGTWSVEVRRQTTQCMNKWRVSWSSYLSAYRSQNKNTDSY